MGGDSEQIVEKKIRHKGKDKNIFYEFITNRRKLKIKRKQFKKLKRWAVEQHNLADNRLFKIEAMEDLLLNKREELATNHKVMEQLKAHIATLLKRESR